MTSSNLCYQQKFSMILFLGSVFLRRRFHRKHHELTLWFLMNNIEIRVIKIFVFIHKLRFFSFVEFIFYFSHTKSSHIHINFLGIYFTTKRNYSLMLQLVKHFPNATTRWPHNHWEHDFIYEKYFWNPPKISTNQCLVFP